MDNAFIEEKEIMKYRFSNLIDLYRKVNMVIIIITMTIMGQEANKVMSNKEKKKSKGNTKPAPKK